ncbi:prolyl aminopeptidase [Luminiphilus sp.]|nr:prolyl aminopeptidase [Luminiphilus sp.]MDB2623140.1 prolyl aminopeptidase [Luminiphilus sp.]MDB2660577.1 prolyl aminopeptidase [Luminiphilus sp.]
MRTLYAPIEPYRRGWLSVGDGHEVYFEESGNPDGKPCVFVHGGPGGGTSPAARQFFDPARYRIVLFDQRGCGQSTPHASLTANTTSHLIDDMERLREELGVEQWLVFGGSWGSTLSLAYAQSHPERVTQLVLRGIFLLRPEEIRWFYQDGASHLFPDSWENYLAPIPHNERHDLVSAFHKRLTSSNEATRLEAARAWSVWEASTSFLRQNKNFMSQLDEPDAALAMARIECHYFVNQGFFNSDNQLLDNIDRIRHIPTEIIQGRYDVVCPPKTAWDLHSAWPEATLHIVPDAGHSAFDPANTSVLVEVTDRFAQA